MAILTIRHLPDPVLKTPTRLITTVTSEIRTLARDMIETMYAADGVGLAANQVGRPWQLFVASSDHVRGQELVLINPVILSRRGQIRAEEGCLSISGVSARVARAGIVRVRGTTLDGKMVELEGHDLMARILQHEIDHLHGHLYIHRLPWFTRRRLLTQYARQQRELARVTH